jgi:quercetin dioxygenase-like cupin family protein
VHIKAGERHWHGARANTTLSHITITTPESESRR